MKSGIITWIARAVGLACCLVMLASCCQNKSCGPCEALNHCKCESKATLTPCEHGTRLANCGCDCDLGWAGVGCNVPAGNITFHHGSDSASVTAMQTTNLYSLTTIPPGNLRVYGYFPSGSSVDTITISGIPQFKGTFPLCDSGCTYVRIAFGQTVESAISISGSITIDSATTSPRYISGSFVANLEITGSANPYYLREGEFNLW